LLYVALAVITDVNFLSGFGTTSGGWLGFVNNQNIQSFAGTILSFIVAMGLLLSVTVVAKKIGAAGSDKAMKWAGKASFGIAAAAVSTPVGWAANRYATKFRQNFVGRVPIFGTGLVRGLDKVAGSSFDIRGTSALKSLPLGGIDAGEASKGGYKTALKERTESRVKYASELKGQLTEAQKDELEEKQNKIKELIQQRADEKADGANAGRLAALDTNINAYKAQRDTLATRNNELSDSTAQRKYATALDAWLPKDHFINRKINFTANTAAATKIRKEAKKSADDKKLDDLAAALKKASSSTT